MKETGWKKTAGNGSDGKRTEGKKSFGRGEKTTGFSKNSAKVGVNGEKQGKSARKVSGVEDKWGTHGDRKRNVGEKDGQKTVRGGQRGKIKCPIYRECGGCQYLHLTYDQQLKEKQKRMEELLGGVCPVRPIIGLDRKNNPISGIYKEGTHRILPVDSCLIEDQKADEIIVTIRSMLRSFKIRVFDEDTGYGLLRHVLIRRGFTTGEILVVLVTASPVFPSKNNFVKALREKHPEITTIVQNINGRSTSMYCMEKDISKMNSADSGSVFRPVPSIRLTQFRLRSCTEKRWNWQDLQARRRYWMLIAVLVRSVSLPANTRAKLSA